MNFKLSVEYSQLLILSAFLIIQMDNQNRFEYSTETDSVLTEIELD